MYADSRRRQLRAGVASLCLLTLALVSANVLAGAKDSLTGHGGVPQPLQQVIRVERARGPVFVTVPVAYVFGLGGDRSPTYCSPSIRTDNSSNAPIEELVVGIDFRTKTGQDAGSAVARFENVKIGRQDTQYFYQLSVNDCRGLDGQVSVVRCVYASGEDCVQDVQVVGHGIIPLHIKSQ